MLLFRYTATVKAIAFHHKYCIDQEDGYIYSKKQNNKIKTSKKIKTCLVLASMPLQLWTIFFWYYHAACDGSFKLSSFGILTLSMQSHFITSIVLTRKTDIYIERERERERHTQRDTQRQTDRQTETERKLGLVQASMRASDYAPPMVYCHCQHGSSRVFHSPRRLKTLHRPSV